MGNAEYMGAMAAAQPTCMPTNWNYRWQLFQGSWYTQVDTARPWAEQVARCETIEPGRMASIASVDDKDVSNMVQKRFDQSVWVGGFELGNSRTFMWYNNGPGICAKEIRPECVGGWIRTGQLSNIHVVQQWTWYLW